MNDFDIESEYRRMNDERLDRIEALLEEQKEARRRTHETIGNILFFGTVILISNAWGWSGLILFALGMWVLSWPWSRWASEWRDALKEAARLKHWPGMIAFVAYVSIPAIGLIAALTAK